MRKAGLIGAVVLVVAAALLVYTQVWNRPGSEELSAEEIVAQSAEAMQTVKSFHFELESQGGVMLLGQGITMSKAQGDLVVPDKLQATLSGTMAGMQVELELISIGDKQYLQNPLSKRWQAMKPIFDISALFHPEQGVPSIMARATEPQVVGKEIADGVDCYRVRGTLSPEDLASLTAGSTAEASVVAEAWIGVQDMRIRQISLNGPILAGEPAELIRVIRLSQYDEEFEIKPPI